MTDLEDVFGEQVAENVSNQVAEKRQERNRVEEEQLKTICARAVNENKFAEGEPMFQHTTDSGLTHDVLLMEVPDPDGREVWEHLEEPWDGAARLPISFLGEWYWCTFPNKSDVAKFDQSDDVLVVGEIDETEGDDGEIYKSIYPVRGIATMEEVKEFAEEELEEQGFETETSSDNSEKVEEEKVSEVEEEVEQESDSSGLDFSESSDSSSTTGGLDSLVEDDDEEEDEEETVVPYEDIAHTIEELSEQQDEDDSPKIFEVEEGTPEHKRLTELTIDMIDSLSEDDAEETAEVIAEVIEEHREEEDDEEDEDESVDKLF